MSALPAKQSRNERVIADFSSHKDSAWVAFALEEQARGVTKDVIREQILRDIGHPFQKKIAELAAIGFPAQVIANQLGVPTKLDGVKRIIAKYAGHIAGIQAAYSQLAMEQGNIEMRMQMHRKLAEKMPKLYEVLDAENVHARNKAFEILMDRTGMPKTIEIHSHIENIVQYSMTGDVKAIFDALRDGKVQLLREGPPDDNVIDVTPEKLD